MSPPAPLLALLQHIGQAPDPRQKLKLLVQLSEKLSLLPVQDRTPERKVFGCNTQVYVKSSVFDQQVSIQGWSDAFVVQGLLALLSRGFEGCAPQMILRLEPSFIQETGLNLSLTPSRTNGFLLIFHKIQMQIIQACYETSV
ncbi:SufE family protein [Synechococcus elongatus]|uniref:SufE family protein n=1 Tax=Synechococcus elongatus PCC 11801 TaxID=2219813 RepID=A0AAN1UV63_SYNEL|nr:SufE family protein [Synechococcus elongatus]AZB73337.1 SufE family protein [Synechococcus elongatus PCC 11801]